MDTRKTIIIYQFSERIKSELIIASQLLGVLDGFDGAEFSGAQKMLCTYLEAVIGEIGIAQGFERSVNFVGAERKVREAIGKIKLNERENVSLCISNAISYVTTACQASMEALMAEKLL